MLEIKDDIQQIIKERIKIHFQKDNVKVDSITFNGTKISIIAQSSIALKSFYSDEIIKLNYFAEGEKKGLLYVNLHHPKLIISEKYQILVISMENLRKEIMEENKLFFIGLELYLDFSK